MKGVQAYRYALDPNNHQRSHLASHCGAARFVFNWALALVKERLEARKQDDKVEVPWSLPALRREWNRAKQAVAPWWAENSKEAYSSGLDALARALHNFSASKKGRRSGRKMGFPRWRRRGRYRDSCRFTTGSIRMLADQRHIQLPRLGVLKTHERTAKLLDRLGSGRARLLSATISREADRWFVSFGCELEREGPERPGSVIGVDVGLRSLAVLSTGEAVPNPRPLERSLRNLRRACRRVSRCRPGSHRRKTAKRRLGRLHARVRNQRCDALHKLTTALTKEHGTVVVERLHVAGMLRNRRLARALADTGMAEIRRQLTYKVTWYGSRLVEAGPFYPSSKTCSQCGWVKAKLSLGERRFVCESCGVILDRDFNAALNLARLAEQVAGSAPETQNARGGECKTGASAPAAACEAGTELPALSASVSEPTGLTGGRVLVRLANAH